DGGAGQLGEVRVVQREGEGPARRTGRDLVGRLELDLDGDLVVDGVAGCGVTDVPVDAVVGEGLGQGAARGGGDGVQVGDMRGLRAGGGGEAAAGGGRAPGQQPAPFGLRYGNGQQPSRASVSPCRVAELTRPALLLSPSGVRRKGGGYHPVVTGDGA